MFLRFIHVNQFLFHASHMETLPKFLQINQSNYFIVRLKVDQTAGQLSLSHLGITKTEKKN